MKPRFTFLIVVIFLLTNCKGQPTKNTSSFRDTSITASNSFSELFLDSAKLETFIVDEHMHNVSAKRLRNFYNSRNYQFAWYTKDGLAEQTRTFLNLHDSFIQLTSDSMQMDKQFHQKMDMLVEEDTTINSANEEIIKTELKLTEHFFKYAQFAYAGKVDPEELQWHIRRKKVNVGSLLDSLIANKGENSERWEPVNQQYKLINKELIRYANLQKAGGWQQILTLNKKSYKPGDTSIAIKQIKQRLTVTSKYLATDTSGVFTKELLPALKQTQKQYGIKQDGIITAALIKELNVPVKDRIEQLLINMERMRWMPAEPTGNRIIANIPDFKLHVFEQAKKVFDLDIVVGTDAHKTVVFNNVIKFIVFSPYWNVPPSIVRKEILPGINKSSNYLADKNMEKTGVENGLPTIRQKPGGNNSLGRVKFMFPNNYNIYFHDTPSKTLFDNSDRAFSHGCIRVKHPEILAQYLLRNQPEWTIDKIDKAMNLSKENWVTLKEPMPVLITYFTVWVDKDGLLNFRNDVYGNDRKMAAHLFGH
jgi:murein L,D-transpeptidase YcbB/YkuD